MDVTVVIPWRGGCSYRERNLEHVTRAYRDLGWEVVVTEGPDPWSKGATVAQADIRTNVTVVADADCWSDNIEDAVEAIDLKQAGWGKPHRVTKRLTPESTESYLNGERENLEHGPNLYRGHHAGGIVVLRTAVLREVPIDPRFTGWGGEDGAWGLALKCLAGNPYLSYAGELFHLWHPPQLAREDRMITGDNERLYHRYGDASQDPARMRQLLEET